MAVSVVLATGGGADRGLKRLDQLVPCWQAIRLATGGGADRGLKQSCRMVPRWSARLWTGGGADRGLKPGVPPMYVGSRPLATGGGADRGLKLDVDADVGLGHHTCDRRRRRSRIETASTTSRPSTRRTRDRRRRRSRIETLARLSEPTATSCDRRRRRSRIETGLGGRPAVMADTLRPAAAPIEDRNPNIIPIETTYLPP